MKVNAGNTLFKSLPSINLKTQHSGCEMTKKQRDAVADDVCLHVLVCITLFSCVLFLFPLFPLICYHSC